MFSCYKSFTASHGSQLPEDLTGFPVGVITKTIYNHLRLRYYVIDPPGLLENTDTDTFHCLYDLCTLIEGP